jgi:tetratricopeptide (TPR) repeat protein
MHASQTNSPVHLYELGLTTAAMSFHTAAIEALRDCTAQLPDHAPAWRKLAEMLRLAGEDEKAAEADAAAQHASASGANWTKGIDERTAAQLEKAEDRFRKKLETKKLDETVTWLSEYLVAHPLDAPAIRCLARIERVGGDEITAMNLLERALDICTDYVGARRDYAELLLARRAPASAAVQTAWLVEHEPGNPYFRHMHSHALFHIGELDKAIRILTELLRDDPGEQQYWLLYAQSLHYLGRRDESVQAFRQCLTIQPDLGEAYWGLADMKGNHITAADIVRMRAALDDDSMTPESRIFMLFALAHALERAGDFAASFAAYDEGSRLAGKLSEQRMARDHPGAANNDVDRFDHSIRIRKMKDVFSRDNLDTKLARAPAAETQETPIFIVGLPRAGSTLTEQILASHSKVEGTRELPLIGDIARDLALSRLLVVPNAYPERILELTSSELAALGARYLARSRDFRKTDRPYFIDKRPWNWLEIGLIHLILPNAKIIDIRREPMAACFGIYKQLITDFSHDLGSLGRYYNRYAGLMQHWESVLPGWVHFVQYERLVEDTESEIRRMLDY